MIVIVDYGRGNLFSLGQALRHLGAAFQVTAEVADIATADRIILPGVGAFGDAAMALGERGLVEVLRERATAGVPLLGICLGMQLLADESDEFGCHQGLGLVPGLVRRLPAGPARIPNVGWRALLPRPGQLDTVDPGTMAYFVHSYALIPNDPADLAATIPFNGAEVAAAVCRRNVVGYQFHPEKSGAAGLTLIRRFLEFSV